MILITLYLFVGIGFAHRRKLDIAVDADGGNLVLTALAWVISWPLWIGRS